MTSDCIAFLNYNHIITVVTSSKANVGPPILKTALRRSGQEISWKRKRCQTN